VSENTVEVITFDLWDTVFADDSDEPKRAAAGRDPKPVERRNLVEKFLADSEPVSRELIDTAYDTTDAAFREVWYGQKITWTVHQRLGVLLKGLKRQLPENRLSELVRLHEEMELEFRPDLATGVTEAIEKLHAKYRLAVISDAIFSPGRALRQLLDGYGILKYFDAFAFSDEIGYAKPMPIVFETIANQLGVELARIVHVGDREQKDIAGPHAVGARGVLCTVIKDRPGDNTKADAICKSFKNLPDIIEKLNQD